MNIKTKKLEVIFYRTDIDSEPVRDWLRKLTREDKKQIGEDIKIVQFGWPLGMPLVSYLGSELWEIRSKLVGGRITRIIFFLNENIIVLICGFIKKTQKTPKRFLSLAKKRKRQYELQ